MLMAGPFCRAQPVEVSDPTLELNNNRLLISYDILHSDPSQEYTVSVRITDEDGNEIPASTLSGDIGDHVAGGNSKQIIWDLTADDIVMNARIFVKIQVKSNVPVETLQNDEENRAGDMELESTDEINVDDRSTAGKVKEYNRTAIIFQSLPLPGLGLSRVSSKPHWIRGMVGYGCIAGSIGLNRLAVNTYDQIHNYSEMDDKDHLFQKSVRQDNISEVLAYAAIGIWVTDMIWTAIGTSDMARSSAFNRRSRFSIRPGYDAFANASMIGFSYIF